MWNMIPLMGNGRRNRGMNTMTAMVIGAGVGIAAWEMVRRNNGTGGAMDQLPNIANTVMKTISQ